MYLVVNGALDFLAQWREYFEFLNVDEKGDDDVIPPYQQYNIL